MESQATSVVLPTEAQWSRVATSIETLMSKLSCAKEQGDISAHLANFVSANESIFHPPTRFIGGGVLEGGNVQEEIRFSICPELVVTMLLCEVMNDHEAIRIEGATRFSCYSGYGGSFKWTGEFDDPTPLSGNSIRDVSLFCVDALPNPGVQQYSKELIEREIRKFYCGVCKYSSMEGEDSLKGVATGNWGCGVFGGDPQLKFVVG
ncbi:hypothetical protein FOZ61_005705 [Perkinsus olseni]|uniref:PARG catalytic Macro domain-containing protein n=1 Tax=Perkinsus olseni TaxID=32597 RepID=A0A7J6LHL8_PEROL|nr:hypothetical protein FOZ61_005705 [Perkinsus olseni]